ncbi:histidine phosphatase family protein [Sphingomonas mollis]|uniref:Histidine phosphatase family protein n=1 Tax=Sphingomonas mollis TaxID=2795726 RepID=A0ABS0XNX4_9SPHN|nr:histidine phosphatase family protein [Sphingomonas sp. BT553]MBJ6121729.1 histidine phosphatase family protein [Sphingomonas sp. BT553]
MSIRLVLLCAGATAQVRQGDFPDADAPLDPGGEAKVRQFDLAGPTLDMCFVSPARAAGDTAALLGLDAMPEPALRDRDHGIWTGRSLDAVSLEEPAMLMAWLATPEEAMPGGESMDAVVLRVGAWLDDLCKGAEDRKILAVTHPAVVRAALAAALDMPIATTFAIDIAPLSTTILSFHNRWRLQELRRA